MMDWFPVDTITPTQYRPVLCRLANGEIHEGYTGTGYRWFVNDMPCDVEVTHWTEMPEFFEDATCRYKGMTERLLSRCIDEYTMENIRNGMWGLIEISSSDVWRLKRTVKRLQEKLSEVKKNEPDTDR